MPAKARTKGKQEIFQENQSALSFYWRISVASSVIHTSVSLLFFHSFSWLHLLASSLLFGAHYLAYRTMRAIARPIFVGGQVLDGGIDLALQSGMGEHMKDVILFSATLLMLVLLHSYAWWLLLCVPIRAIYVIWPYLSPWLRSAPDGMEPEKPKKKREKRVYK